MHPVGIALAFLVFWSMVAVGGFLLAFCFNNLRHSVTQIRLSNVSSLRAASAVRAVVNFLGAAIGLSLASMGLFATYTVIYGR
ncbi:MAG: hypothetical protein QN198_01825 [Armatimonadota bacterium]|nr:hypothetical protein [Armatimonadota bacterium]MDR5702325.1 hypothetical protein [Armatimonadota bacterium]MDR7435930.1 hypothetical protein [Armatimonadota bacterium]